MYRSITVLLGIAVLIVSIFLAGTPIPVAALGEVVVSQQTVIVGGEVIEPVTGELLLDEGERVTVYINLEKIGDPIGTVFLSSDLVNAEGLMRFNLEDYYQSTIPIEITGTVPPALVKKGREIRCGEADFVLVTVVVEGNPHGKTLVNMDARATNPALHESMDKLDGLAATIAKMDKSYTQELSEEIYHAGERARENGDPELAIALVEAAENAMKIDQTAASTPGWYIPVMVVLGIIAVIGWLVVFRPNTSAEKDPFDIGIK